MVSQPFPDGFFDDMGIFIGAHMHGGAVIEAVNTPKMDVVDIQHPGNLPELCFQFLLAESVRGLLQKQIQNGF